MNVGDTVASIIRDVLQQPDLRVTSQTTARDVAAWDSFAMVKMIILMQETFGFEFESDELDGIQNVGDVVRLVEGRRP